MLSQRHMYVYVHVFIKKKSKNCQFQEAKIMLNMITNS